MKRITTIFLIFNGIGVTIACLLAKYDPENSDGWNLVAASMFGFGFLWLMLAIAFSRLKIDQPVKMRRK